MNTTSKHPLVSIVIPVYNHEKYVEEALNSVLNQTYPNLEVIIIDDGSKDKSPELVDQWLAKMAPNKKMGREFIFHKQKNQGAHATINRGLSLAKGNFLTILNSDDFYDLTRIEKLFDRLQFEQGELIFSGVKGIDGNGKDLPLGHHWRNGYEGCLASVGHTPTVGFQLLQANLAISTGNLFFTRTLYNDVGEFKDLKLAHDYDFLLRALVVTEPIFLQEELYFYRVHDSNTFSQLLDRLQIELNEIYREYLLHVSSKAPKNPQAPCHWYWPLAFSLTRKQFKLDQGLVHYLSKGEGLSNTVNHPIANPVLPKPKKKLKISLISHNLSLSGSPKVVLDLATYLKQMGHSVNVISLFDGSMRKELEAHQIPLYVLPSKAVKGMKHRFKWVRVGCAIVNSILLFFKSKSITIGNSSVVGDLLMLQSFLRPFSKFYWYLHDSFPPSSLFNVCGHKEKLINYIKRNPRFKLWFGSHDTRLLWEKSGFFGTTNYWSGIPAHSNTPPLSKKPIKEILAVGTTSPRKGTHYLIEAFINGIKEKKISDDVNLTIIGFFEDVNFSHDYVGDLILQVVHSGFKDRIKLVSNLQPDELDSYYAKADLFVQCSVVECLPLAILQAMSLGLPIITTDVNGCVEAIEDEKTGYVCIARNSRVLLNTLLKAINNPEKSRELGREAQKVFNEKFCLEKNMIAIQNILDA